MPHLTPGVKLIGRGVVYATAFVGGLVGATHIARSQGIFAPLWIVITGAIVACPLLTGIYIAFGEFKKKRRAAALGARIVPKCVGTLPGNLDILTGTLKAVAVGYPGESRVSSSSWQRY